MIEHAWSVLCSKCITDPESRNASLIEVLENINYQADIQLPALAPFTTDFVTCWYRTNPTQPARGAGRVTVIRPDGQPSDATEYAIDLTTFVFVHAVTRSGGILLSGRGVYFFQVEFKIEGSDSWTTVTRIPLQVEAYQTLPGTAAQPAPPSVAR
jgi:hypothetical protein